MCNVVIMAIADDITIPIDPAAEKLCRRRITTTIEGLTPEWCLRAAHEGLRLQVMLDAILAQDAAVGELAAAQRRRQPPPAGTRSRGRKAG